MKKWIIRVLLLLTLLLGLAAGVSADDAEVVKSSGLNLTDLSVVYEPLVSDETSTPPPRLTP